MPDVVLITGASSGIGKAVGMYLSKKGYKIYGTSRTPEKYPNSEYELLTMEMNNPASISETLKAIIAKEGRIDVLINNAGIGITGALEEIPLTEIHRAFQINLYAPIQLMQEVLPYMRNAKKGRIINITSIAAYMGLPYRGIYSSTKAALKVATEALRMETRDFHIKMSNVAPGDFATNIASSRYQVPKAAHSAYKNTYSQILKLMEDEIDKGRDPIEIGKLVYRIITTKNPKVNYKVGSFLQKVSVALKSILPDKMYEKLLRNHYKL